MDESSRARGRPGHAGKFLVGVLLLGGVIAAVAINYCAGFNKPRAGDRPRLAYQERRPIDTGGFMAVLGHLNPWTASASLEQVRDSFQRAGYRNIEQIDQILKRSNVP